ncbi:uro-adherence factor A-like [Palaemon carinicauda]|uniref:uro-adherence factor A-like n=1 Tax=Palaemon carinicauda TaxID=392227 RepID=UPI0035B64874
MKGEFADEKSETTALMSGLLSIKKEKNHAKNEFLSIKNERSRDKDVSNDLDMSQVYHTRRTTNFQTISSVTGFTTPKNRKSKSKIGSSEKKSDEDKHRTNELEEQRLHQHSPDTPFMSSQLLGTQECEVVWDCNSPGFSKDDLKRMCGDTGSDENTSPAIPEFVAPIPNRALFTRTRSRKASNISAVDTTAQLDELLNQLSAKGSLSKDDESIGPTSIPAHYLQGKSASENLKIPRTLPVDKESLPATPPVPINLITKTSSEPFDVWEGSQTGIDDCGDIFESDNQADLGILEETTWDEDLNVALCDVSSGDIVDSSQIKTVNNKSHSCKISEAVDKVKNNDSLDVFDDDYFNDTLIESTQIWEKEILEKGIEKANLHVTTSETKALEDDCFLEKNGCEKSRSFTNLKDKVKKNHCANRSTNMLGKSALLSCPPSEDTDSIKSADEIIRSSPVKDNTQISYSKVENVPQRRMRSSFRLTDNPQTGFLSEKSKQININSINSSKETKSGQKDVVIGNIQNSSGSEVNYTKCDTDIGSNRPLPRFRNIEHNLPKLQNRKALFASGANNISVEKNYGKTDFTKSSFPRSQSTGSSQGQEAKLGISRPSKSEDAEGSREFEEDDSFFDSLLSALPEDEIILGTLKNSEVCDGHNKTSHFTKETVRASKTMFNSSVNSSDKSKVFSRWGDKRKSNNESVKKIVSDQNRNLSSSVVESSVVNSSKRNIPPKRCSMPGEKSMIASLTNSSRIGMSASKLMSYSEDSRELNSKSTLSSSTVKQEFQEKSHTADISDDDLFEDDVLSLIDEVESSPRGTSTGGGQAQFLFYLAMKFFIQLRELKKQSCSVHAWGICCHYRPSEGVIPSLRSMPVTAPDQHFIFEELALATLHQAALPGVTTTHVYRLNDVMSQGDRIIFIAKEVISSAAKKLCLFSNVNYFMPIYDLNDVKSHFYEQQKVKCEMVYCNHKSRNVCGHTMCRSHAVCVVTTETLRYWDPKNCNVCSALVTEGYGDPKSVESGEAAREKLCKWEDQVKCKVIFCNVRSKDFCGHVECRAHVPCTTSKEALRYWEPQDCKICKALVTKAFDDPKSAESRDAAREKLRRWVPKPLMTPSQRSQGMQHERSCAYGYCTWVREKRNGTVPS